MKGKRKGQTDTGLELVNRQMLVMGTDRHLGERDWWAPRADGIKNRSREWWTQRECLGVVGSTNLTSLQVLTWLP